MLILQRYFKWINSEACGIPPVTLYVLYKSPSPSELLIVLFQISGQHVDTYRHQAPGRGHYRHTGEGKRYYSHRQVSTPIFPIFSIILIKYHIDPSEFSYFSVLFYYLDQMLYWWLITLIQILPIQFKYNWSWILISSTVPRIKLAAHALPMKKYPPNCYFPNLFSYLNQMLYWWLII